MVNMENLGLEAKGAVLQFDLQLRIPKGVCLG